LLLIIDVEHMIGIFGGTFNPVHWGHIRTAIEIKNTLSLEKMLLIPCRIPPHRDEPSVSAQLRLAMLEAAITNYSELEVDERELNRPGPSYTVDTLASIRQEHTSVPLGLCMGVDAFIKLDSWHEWIRLFEFAHIIIVHRPGWHLEQLGDKISSTLRKVIEHRITTSNELLHKSANGLVLPLKVTNIDISSSDIRRRISLGKSVEEMLPRETFKIIQREKLYQNSTV